MRRFALSLSVVAAAALSFSAPVHAADDEKKKDSEEVESAKKAPKKICKMINGSESRLKRKRVCLTAEEWKQVVY